MKNSVWITWESQPRNLSMAKFLDTDFEKIEFNKGFFLRYILCCFYTVKVFSRKYETVIVQNPSIILCALAAFFKPFYGYKLVIDAHNAGVFPKEGKYASLIYANSIILRCADLVIVTNESIVSYLKKKNIFSISITDPLPNYEDSLYRSKREKNKVFVICSWADDEPIDLYLQVASILPDYDFYFSGNYRKFNFDDYSISENVNLLGFISETDYLSLLFTASVTIDLTLRDSCLVCGAYESIAAEVPVVLTDNEVNRNTFEDAALYCSIDMEHLAETIISSEKFQKRKIINFKDRYKKSMINKCCEFYNIINSR